MKSDGKLNDRVFHLEFIQKKKTNFKKYNQTYTKIELKIEQTWKFFSVYF